jgi:hypothetical protein
MARKSLRTSDIAAPRSSSKRPNPSEATAERTTPPKRGKPNSSKAASKKSTRAAHQSSDDEMEETEASPNEDSAESEDFEVDSSSEEDEELESDFENENDEVSHRSRKGKGSSTKETKAHTTSAELWRPGVKTGLGPGTQVVIKKPKARDAGSIPYMDNTIHPNTMLFLEDLAANNDRQWLKSELFYSSHPDHSILF